MENLTLKKNSPNCYVILDYLNSVLCSVFVSKTTPLLHSIFYILRHVLFTHWFCLQRLLSITKSHRSYLWESTVFMTYSIFNMFFRKLNKWYCTMYLYLIQTFLHKFTKSVEQVKHKNITAVGVRNKCSCWKVGKYAYSEEIKGGK